MFEPVGDFVSEGVGPIWVGGGRGCCSQQPGMRQHPSGGRLRSPREAMLHKKSSFTSDGGGGGGLLSRHSSAASMMSTTASDFPTRYAGIVNSIVGNIGFDDVEMSWRRQQHAHDLPQDHQRTAYDDDDSSHHLHRQHSRQSHHRHRRHNGFRG